MLVDDLYLIPGYVHEQKHTGVWLIGVANKSTVFATLMGLTK